MGDPRRRARPHGDRPDRGRPAGVPHRPSRAGPRARDPHRLCRRLLGLHAAARRQPGRPQPPAGHRPRALRGRLLVQGRVPDRLRLRPAPRLPARGRRAPCPLLPRQGLPQLPPPDARPDGPDHARVARAQPRRPRHHPRRGARLHRRPPELRPGRRRRRSLPRHRPPPLLGPSPRPPRRLPDARRRQRPRLGPARRRRPRHGDPPRRRAVPHPRHRPGPGHRPRGRGSRPHPRPAHLRAAAREAAVPEPERHRLLRLGRPGMLPAQRRHPRHPRRRPRQPRRRRRADLRGAPRPPHRPGS